MCYCLLLYLFFFILKTLIVTMQGRKKSLVFCCFVLFFLQINVLILWSFVKMFRVMSLLQLVLKWGVTHEPFVSRSWLHQITYIMPPLVDSRFVVILTKEKFWYIVYMDMKSMKGRHVVIKMCYLRFANKPFH